MDVSGWMDPQKDKIKNKKIQEREKNRRRKVMDAEGDGKEDSEEDGTQKKTVLGIYGL